MSKEPKLSKNFNSKLFGEIKRNLLFKNILSITLISFFKIIVSLFDVFAPSKSSNKDFEK